MKTSNPTSSVKKLELVDLFCVCLMGIYYTLFSCYFFILRKREGVKFGNFIFFSVFLIPRGIYYALFSC